MAEADKQRLAVWAHSEPSALHPHPQSAWQTPAALNPQCRLQDMDSGTGAGTGSLQLFYTWRDFGQSHQANFPIVSPGSPAILSLETPGVSSYSQGLPAIQLSYLGACSVRGRLLAMMMMMMTIVALHVRARSDSTKVLASGKYWPVRLPGTASIGPCAK